MKGRGQSTLNVDDLYHTKSNCADVCTHSSVAGYIINGAEAKGGARTDPQQLLLKDGKKF